MTIRASGLSLASPLPYVGQDIIKASWRRCLSEYQLDPSNRDCVAISPKKNKNVLQCETSEWLSDAAGIIDRIRKAARDVDRIVIVANADGVIVSSHADSPITQEILREGFAIGSILHEQWVGTNGIGTCIASRQAITVHGDAHFNESFRGFTCSAAPVFTSDGSVLAVVDISGRLNGNSAEGRFAQHFIREAAQHISLLLFRKRHKNDCIITLSRAEDSNQISTPALIATDGAGNILGATAEGYAYLGVSDLQALAQRSLGELCNANFGDLKPLSQQAVRLQTPNGAIAYATAFMEKRLAAAPSTNANGAMFAPVTKELDRIAGSDAAMLKIVRLCRKVAGCDLPLVLLGETGVGKDTLARAIHAESSRASKPYVAVNCAAIPATLLASELFGYAPGTFTGGIKGGKIGKIAASDGGTLFLDEIGDMPLDLQAHLLRVLEERAVTPLGSATAAPIDIEIICATHRDLPHLVNAGLFRKDLYYRIRGVQFTIPAVRDRTDLPALVASLIEDEGKICGCSFAGINVDAMELLARHAWPGNIRELRNVIRYAASLHGNECELRLEHLPEYLLETSRVQIPYAASSGLIDARPAYANNKEPVANERQPPCPTLRGTNIIAERARITHVLRENYWNMTVAAQKLGVSRSTLYRKLRQHSIPTPNPQTDT